MNPQETNGSPRPRALPAAQPVESGAGAPADEALPTARSRASQVREVSTAERQALLRGLRERAEAVEAMRREMHALRELLDVSRELSSIHDPDALYDAILDAAIRLTETRRGLLLQRYGDRLIVLAGRRAGGEPLGSAHTVVSETLARECLERNQVCPYGNLQGSGHREEAHSIDALDLHAAVTVPLRDQGTPFGVLYLDTNVPGIRASTAEIPLLEAFASQAAIACLNVRRIQSLEESRLLLRKENEELRREVRSECGLGQMVGRSRPMLALFDKIRQLTDVGVPVLVEGPSGAGKELVARALHFEGNRASGPFIAVNCAGLAPDLLDSSLFGHKRGAFTGALNDNPGLVEAAAGGTLFLDEVGDMPSELQVKLLRFLESGEFLRVGDSRPRRISTRVVSATNRDLLSMVRMDRFRKDLYFRLAGIRLEIPPLADRSEDIPLLIDHFLAGTAGPGGAPRGMTARARAYLLRYSWPGNIRQMRHAIDAACAVAPAGEDLDEPHLRLVLADEDAVAESPAGSLQESRSRVEKQALENALTQHRWNITRASQALGISRQHLHNRIRVHGLHRPPGA